MLRFHKCKSFQRHQRSDEKFMTRILKLCWNSITLYPQYVRSNTISPLFFGISVINSIQPYFLVSTEVINQIVDEISVNRVIGGFFYGHPSRPLPIGDHNNNDKMIIITLDNVNADKIIFCVIGGFLWPPVRSSPIGRSQYL